VWIKEVMGKINQTALAKLPYLNATALGERAIFLMPMWDGQAWHLWINTPDGDLIEMHTIDTVHSNYLAKKAANDADIFVAFIDFMSQRASWPELVRLIAGICDDFHMMATCAAKLEYFHRTRDSIDRLLIASFVRSEIEYLIVLARSVFDLVQEVISIIWNNRVRLSDPTAEALRKQHRLPRTFSDVVLKGETLRTAEQIGARYGLPPLMAEQYAKQAPFFSSLRAARERIIHGGSRIDTIFATERGFCVSPQSKLYGDYPWTEAHRYNENLVSLRPWIARIIFKTVEACSDVMSGLAGTIPFPEEMAPGYHVFVRDPANGAYSRLLKVATGEIIWWDDLSNNASK
jgi:hypothetical protein